MHILVCNCDIFVVVNFYFFDRRSKVSKHCWGPSQENLCGDLQVQRLYNQVFKHSYDPSLTEFLYLFNSKGKWPSSCCTTRRWTKTRGSTTTSPSGKPATGLALLYCFPFLHLIKKVEEFQDLCGGKCCWRDRWHCFLHTRWICVFYLFYFIIYSRCINWGQPFANWNLRKWPQESREFWGGIKAWLEVID